MVRSPFLFQGRGLGHQDHTHVFDRIGRREIVRLETGTDHVNELAFSPDDSLLAAAGPGADVQLWDARSWNNARLLEGHTAAIYSISLSSDGKLGSSSYDGTVRVRDLSSADEWVLQDDEGDPMRVAFSPDGRTLAVGTFDGAIKLWHVASRQQIATFEAGASIVRSLMFDREGTALTSTTFDRQIRVWQAPSWAEIEAIESSQKK